MSTLLLVRHGESEWNASGKIAGRSNIALTQEGLRQAAVVGKKLQSFIIDTAYTSTLLRAKQSFDAANKQVAGALPEPSAVAALDERDFGTYTGLDKAELLQDLGAKAYAEVFSEWYGTAPEGESLKMVYERVSEFFDKTLTPDLESDKTVLIVAHHHTLRALIAHIEHLSPKQTALLRLGNASCTQYTFERSPLLLVNKALID